MAFDAWLDRFFASYFRHHPVSATFIGVHDHDHRLPDFSEEGAGSLLADTVSLLDAIDSHAGEDLPVSSSIDRKLARGFLQIQRWELESGYLYRRNPAFYTGEAIFGVFSLLLRDFAPRRERLEAASERLAAIPRWLAQGRENVAAAPRAWTERAIRECDAAFAFFDDGLPRLDAPTQMETAVPEGRRAFAAFREHLDHLPEADFRCGEEALERLLNEAHFLDWSADDIVARASESLRRAEAELVSGAARHGAADFREALSRLDELRPPRGESASWHRRIWSESRSLAEERKLVTWPDYPVDFVPQPDWARSAAPGLYFLLYRSPAPYDRLPRSDFLLPPAEVNESVIKLNHVVHHAGLGHHVQNWYAMRAESRIGRIAAVDCASRIAMLCGGTMAEGWASYATELMDEAGFLTPLESFSEHRARARAAARAIVDVEVHRGRMSFEEAESFYREKAGMSPSAARAEVTKNTMFPAAGLIYFVGNALIRELRARCEGRIGLRELHDRLLSFGSIPVSLAARELRPDD